jgi:dTDP-4-dehydrorhamnose 3,5-epimerase
MKVLSCEPLPLPGALLLRFARFRDDRGYFTETYRDSDFQRLPGLEGFEIRQVNESRSRAGVVRGLHFQWSPAMGKLVRTVEGHMVDLMLDVRVGSPTFGRAIGVDMPADPQAASDAWVWLPPGLAHGNVYLRDSAIEYLCTASWNPAGEAGVSPLAADIDWSLCEAGTLRRIRGVFDNRPVLSEKDLAGPTLAQWLADPRSAEFRWPG